MMLQRKYKIELGVHVILEVFFSSAKFSDPSPPSFFLNLIRWGAQWQSG